MQQPASTVTFFPMLTEEAKPWGNACRELIAVPSPIEVKCPILTAFYSARIVTLYQIVAHLLTMTSPTSVALGATQAFDTLGTQSYSGMI